MNEDKAAGGRKVMIEVEEEFAAGAQAMARLLKVMKRLRAEDGCPWDREQTHESLRKYLIEESYEAAAAIDEGGSRELCKELGDVLLQVAFHAQIGRESGEFDFAAVADTVADKMIYRHPHVFGGRDDIETADDVLKIWEVLKSKEQLPGDEAADGEERSIIDVPRQLPALMRAEKIQAKASRVGFDWPDISGPRAKVEEELAELAAAEPEDRAGEFGDLLFSLVNLARFMDIDPEAALSSSNEKFIRRFRQVEAAVRESGREWQSFSLDELDRWWDAAKAGESKTEV